MKSPEKNNTTPVLELTVDGEHWTCVPSFSNKEPEDQVYTLERETGVIRFGGGVHGKRLPAGATIRAEYQYGGGEGGNVADGPTITLTWKQVHFTGNQKIETAIHLSSDSILFNASKKCRKLSLSDLVLSVLPWPFHKDLPANYCGRRSGISFKDLVLLALCKSIATRVYYPSPNIVLQPRTWVVRKGDRLAGIAEEVYGDPAMWREIARENGIENPRLLTPGTVLTLPKFDE